MNFEDYKIKEFVNELSSSSPTPGGGSVAGVVLSLSASLNSMVYSLTIGKKSYNNLSIEKQKKMDLLYEKCKELRDEALNLMNMDKKYFEELMDGYKLPKETQEEKNHRTEEIKKRTYKALQSPLKMAREGIKFYENIEFAVENGNKMLVSDAGVAASLLHAAIKSAIINVEVNLSSLKTESYYNELKEELLNIEKKSKQISEEILKKVDSQIC
ncbi:MAG: cyclodeaminase/cyclohydrolase family protein [Clostridium sp.]